MSILETLLERPRVTFSVAVLLAFTGVAAWFTMPRLEDPEMSDRWGLAITPYPGADPETIERTVLAPLEEELAQVGEFNYVDSTARSGFAIVTMELRDSVDVDQIDRIWDDVEKALERAARDFPEGAGKPELDRDVSEPEAIVLAITGGELEQLSRAADRVERALLGVRGVESIKRIGDPGEQVTVEMDPAVARRLGITRRMLAGALASRHSTIPAGFVEVDGRTASLRPNAELTSVEEIAATPIPLASGAAVPLSDVANVTLGPTDPVSERMRVNRHAAVGLGIVPKRPIDFVAFGGDIRTEIKKLEEEIAPLRIEEVAFQPDYVETRLNDLGLNLLQSIAVVAAVLLFMMGARMGILIGAAVPLVTLASLGVYAGFGGVLHQMSIAALVIAIGTWVDNAIVVAEDVQSRLDAGASKADAMKQSVVSLAIPLGSATGTNIASFVPMLMAEGPVAEFTRALPIVITLTLALSYGFALFVTPVLAAALKPSFDQRDDWMVRLGRRAGELAVGRKKTVLAGAVITVAASVALSSRVDQNFFPLGDRNQLVVDLALPEGADINRIDALSLKLERALESRPEVVSVTSFIGRGTPHFYYNLWSFPRSPHRAEVVVVTKDIASTDVVQRWIREYSRTELPELSVAAHKLEQGPSIAAPVEVRIYGPDLPRIARATEQVLREVGSASGTVDLRETLGTGIPAVRVKVDDATASRHGMSRTDVVLALLGETHGLEVAKLRSERDPVPVLVRAPLGHHMAPELLDSVAVARDTPMLDVPLAEIADTETVWLPAAVRHRNRQRMTTVLADLDQGVTFTDVMRELDPKLKALKLPPGVKLEIGGVGEGSSEANQALLVTMPFGLLLLVGFLILEFNSFRRVGIILTTIPLAAAGIIPGLLIGNQPFGFMSMLGVTGLAGVVVNNAIVLLDLADRLVAEGASVDEATSEAVRARTRPILLTATTTVVGLLPLAFSESTLWPPLAWAMISGLTASTLLTLLVVPALYASVVRAPKTPSAIAAE